MPAGAMWGTLVLRHVFGGDADAEAPLAAPQAERIERDGKGVVSAF
ncbi:MAG: hypothetical protein ACRDZ0_01910 [Acidimicrobiales bacterium]